jgi:sarcosine oxidase
VPTGSRRTPVITVGPWASRLLGPLGIPFRVLRKVQLWFGVREGSYRQTPCFLYERPQGAFYGFPSRDGVTIKVAEHTGGAEVEAPALVDRRCHPEDVAPVAALVRESLPRAEPQVLRHSVCLYTMSPDGHFVVDRHPEWENVVWGAGFSGHGFKFTGVLGEVLADLVSTGATSLPVEFLRLSRLMPARKD